MMLGELTTLIRSKNAGPFVLTIDIMFKSNETYDFVRKCGELTAAALAELYGIPEDQVMVYWHDRLCALKVTVPRPVSAGGPHDWDTFGCQWHAPLVAIQLPEGQGAGSEG